MKIFKLIFIPIGFLLTLIIGYSCSCSSCSKEEQADVPLNVLNKANEFIITKTGEEFFNKYITPDFSRTKYIPPYYEMEYRFYMPEKDYVLGKIKFTVDTTGNVIETREVTGIPNNKKKPYECNFTVNKDSAIQIAKENGLKKGIKDWDVGFIWNPQRQIYVWHVLSTLHEMKGDIGYRGNGQEAIISPVTGEVLEMHDWKIN
jgi:hypothetical protein